MAKTDLTKEIEFYKTIIKDLKVVIDVGCRDDNVFYELNNDLEVHLFDPNEVGIGLEVEGLNKVHFNNYALGSEQGIAEFHYRYGSILHRTEEPKFNGMHDSRFVRLDTLENYCKEMAITNIDFLKIDTEGFDFEVIKGCGKYLDKIKYIQFEEWLEGYAKGHTVSDVFRFFKGYNIYKINTKPVNYVATKETIDSLEKVQ